MGALTTLSGIWASKKGSAAQSDAMESAMQMVKDQMAQNRADLAPYRNVGYQALYGQASMAGLKRDPFQIAASYLGAGPALNLLKRGKLDSHPLVKRIMQMPEYDFKAEPGYQFRFAEGQRAVDTGAAARAGLYSGANLKAQTKYGQNVASQEYGNVYNRLGGLSGQGQSAVNTGIGANSSLMPIAAQHMADIGAARASGYKGQAQAINQGVQNTLQGAAVAGSFMGGGM